MSFEAISSNKAFEGTVTKYKTKSESLGGLETQFNVFVPKEASSGTKVPTLYYLAGLTCTEDNGAQKAGFLRDAAAEGLALVFPDTSPRGAGVEGETDSWDFGVGAGFYLNATNPKFAKHYNMDNWVTKELPDLLEKNKVPLDRARTSIFGHSMGGHGALTLYLLYPDLYKSSSAFAPITHPTKAAWGKKAFQDGPDGKGGYLKGGLEEGKGRDATELIKKVGGEGRKVKILVDQGTGDNFYKQGQLHPEHFQEAAKSAGLSDQDVQVNLRDGYDHSYYFISTFGPDHIKFHAKVLKA